MAGSRAANNAKLLRRHQRQQSSAAATSSGNKFTQKQSHFERRREEEQVRQQGSSASGLESLAPSRAVGDGLLSRRSGWDRRDTNGSQENAAETPNPFQRPRGTSSVAASGGAAATTRSATMGLEAVPKSTRSTRRIDRFNLSSSASAPPAEGNMPLMGVRRVRESETPIVDGADETGDAQPAKMTRAERFKEMVSNSKGQRALLQRERAERDAATLELDAEINGLLHLLPRRNKISEEQEAFANSGTPEVRALLASYRRGHEAKCLTLKSSGAFEVRTLAETARTAPSDPSAAPSTTPPPPAAAAEGMDTAAAFLDAADRALLARIRNGASRSTEEGEATAVAKKAAPASRQVQADRAEAHQRPAAADDFDTMLHAFHLDPRRAHAVARTLTEEEESAEAARQALLREDRQQLPSLGLQERDQTQLTRGEWVGQGGDVAFQMDAAETGSQDMDAEDNVDIPSSFEGDSDGDEAATDVDSEGAGETGEAEKDDEEQGEEGEAGASSTQRVGGSRTLDHLLEELEKLSATVGNDGDKNTKKFASRPQHLHEVLVALHRYASQHIVEVTKAFRLILVEAERSFLRGTRRGGLRRVLLVYLYAITKIFPTSDYRHEVMTPFLLFICSALMQMTLDSLEAVHSYLVLTTLLLHCLKAGGGKYCAEAVTAVLNVLSLQLPRSVMEPVRYQGSRLSMPLLDRPEAPLLLPKSSSADGASKSVEAPQPAYQISLFDITFDGERLLLCGYRLYEELCDLYTATPAFPVMCAEPFLALDALLHEPRRGAAAENSWQPSSAVRLAQEALAVKVRDVAVAAQKHRTPLAMRTFRPRPIRLFDPLLAEREENAVKNEVRIMKRDIREDKKRLMRHLTAEATVQRRAQERRSAVDDAQRERRYHNVMNQLQQQQHSMNTVESLKSKAKVAKKKGISGESNAKPAENGNDD